jgi:ATP-dependent RNA helicase DBP3
MTKQQCKEEGIAAASASTTNKACGSALKKRKVTQSDIPLSNREPSEQNGKPIPTNGEQRQQKRLRKPQKQEGRNKGASDILRTGEEGIVNKVTDKAKKRRLEELKGGTSSMVEVSGIASNGAYSASAITMPTTQDLTGAFEYQEDHSLSALPQVEIDSFLSSKFVTVTDPTTSKVLRPITSFSQLPQLILLNQSLFNKFKNPTPIQSVAWPFILAGRDVIGVAETGSGKTLAFGVPCIHYISSLPPRKGRGSVARAVIVSPTRELAVQIHEQIVSIATPTGLKSVCVYGGVPKHVQREALRTAQIVVATPGRLNDLINEGSADLSEVGYVVLDEADRMLDKGFEEEIRKIISTTASPSPTKTHGRPGRQTLMFTATWPPPIRNLAATFMRSPVKIVIGDNPAGELRANTRIVQKVEVVDSRSKETRLLQLIKEHQSGKERDHRILVFCLYKKEARRVEVFLRNKGLRVTGIHGDLSQEKRSASLEAFKRDGGTPLLVATDVAARGLDIPEVKVVINVTFPLTVEDYVHRIGRWVCNRCVSSL